MWQWHIPPCNPDGPVELMLRHLQGDYAGLGWAIIALALALHLPALLRGPWPGEPG